MEAATRNPDSATPLPLFRPEALAARQNFHGEVLSIRQFSLVFLCCLTACVTAAALAFLLLARYTPTAKVLGEISSEDSPQTANAHAPLVATFHVGAELVSTIQSGTPLMLRCVRCSRAVFLKGTVVSVTELQPSAAASTGLARPGSVHQVTVAVSPLDSPPTSGNELKPGMKLEAEFPLARRTLFRGLIGPAAVLL